MLQKIKMLNLMGWIKAYTLYLTFDIEMLTWKLIRKVLIGETKIIYSATKLHSQTPDMENEAEKDIIFQDC